MRDRKQIREAIEGVTAEAGGWDSPPTWSQIADVLGALLAPAQAGGDDDFLREGAAEIRRKPAPEPDARPMLTEWMAHPRDCCGDDGRRRERKIDGKGGVVVEAYPIDETWRWDVLDSSGLELSGGGAPDLAAAKRAADEAAAKWYRLPAPAPGPGDAASAPFAALDDRRAIVSVLDAVCNRWPVAPNGAVSGADFVDIKANGRIVRVTARLRDAAPAPADLRERAIRAVAEGLGDPVDYARARIEEKPDGPAGKIVVAVERALREEREAAYQRGRADAAKTREEAPAGVLAVVEATIVGDSERDDLPAFAVRAEDEDEGRIDIEIQHGRVKPGQRVTVAVLTGPLAGIVEAHRAREAFAEHVNECEAGCAFDRNGNPHTFGICDKGQRLAAAVKPIK